MRHHVVVQSGHPLPPDLVRPGVLALSALAQVMLAGGEVAPIITRVAQQAGLDETLMLHAARAVQLELDAVR